jgi:uncharacterized phage protein (TIGR01671 family)
MRVPAVRFEVIMQSTGLCDSEGVEIFEGDRLAVIDPNGEQQTEKTVKWDAAACTYPIELDGYEFDVTSLGWAQQYEYQFRVIGNIYEPREDAE